MVIFAGVMLGWGALILLRKVKLPLIDDRWNMFGPLLVAVMLGFAIGFTQNEPMKAFHDGNAYLYLFYLLPLLCVRWDPESKRALLQVFFASATWVALLTIGILYVFTHFPEWMLGPVYEFLRDTRTGELTKMVGNIFRIFLQAQISVIFAVYILAPLLWVQNTTKRDRWKMLVALSLAMAVILISLSRSFWIGIIAGDAVLVILAWRSVQSGIPPVAKAFGTASLGLIAGAILLIAIILFPLPYRVGTTGDLSALFGSRTTDLSDVAVSSRWKLLPEQWKEVMASPVLGSGFGEEVQFQTDDPRVRAFSPDGTWTTFALEWGWLELWLKMGVLGPIAFLWLFYSLWKHLIPAPGDERAWLSVGLLSALVMLYVTHFFSPYLNHPLGLGFLLFLVPFIKVKTPVAEPTRVKSPIAVAAGAVQASTTPFTSE
jgi:branched-subunit amino acid transport protein